MYEEEHRRKTKVYRQEKEEANQIALGLEQLLDALPQREFTRRYAEQFEWFSTSSGQNTLFNEIILK